MKFRKDKDMNWIKNNKNYLIGISVASAIIIIIYLIPTKEPIIDFDCKDFIDWVDAQTYFEHTGGADKDVSLLDADLNGVACESYNFGEGNTFEDQGWGMMP